LAVRRREGRIFTCEKKYDGKNVTFFDLLTILSAGGLLTAVWVGVHAGIYGILIGMIIGLGIGSVFTVGFRYAGSWFINKYSQNLIFSWLFTIVAFAWIAASYVLGAWLTKLVINALLGKIV
jgi:hypothetical protein